MLDEKLQRNALKFAILLENENPHVVFVTPNVCIANFEAFRWNFFSSTNPEIVRSDML